MSPSVTDDRGIELTQELCEFEWDERRFAHYCKYCNRYVDRSVFEEEED